MPPNILWLWQKFLTQFNPNNCVNWNTNWTPIISCTSPFDQLIWHTETFQTNIISFCPDRAFFCSLGIIFFNATNNKKNRFSFFCCLLVFEYFSFNKNNFPYNKMTIEQKDICNKYTESKCLVKYLSIKSILANDQKSETQID